MPVTLQFNKFSEKKPEHEQEIIWLRGVTSFGASGFDPQHITVYYSWFGMDEDGEYDGQDVEYNGEAEMDGCELGILFEGEEPDKDTLWMPMEEYWKALGFED